MAGYIMTLDSVESLIECITKGVYSTKFGSINHGRWDTAKEGTFADYYSMKQDDYIFFFIKRKIYGIGQLIDIGGECKYLNYSGAGDPINYSVADYRSRDPLIDWGNPGNRCICFFKPHPFFFKKSVDMDEALSSAPSKFKMLRAMWKLSFVKIDDEEAQALFDIILKSNEDNLQDGKNIFPFDSSVHDKALHRIKQHHRMEAYSILTHCSSGLQEPLKHEMAIEAYLCSVLGQENDTPFGKWDYISHQVVASPFKPIDYMDKIDLFGYRYIGGYKTISKYLVAEIKRDSATTDVIDQIMKYVDWVNQEYAHGDYSMIEAYVIASNYPEEVIRKRDAECIRNYIKGYRPSEAAKWSNVRLIKYEYQEEGLLFREV